jgi:hypothetical protein
VYRGENMSALLQDSARSRTAPIPPAISPIFNGSPFQYVIRCVVEKKGNQWQAFSLELGLAAQADTGADARQKLESMIHSYIDEAVYGEDRAYAYDLLSRKGTWRVYLLYYLASAVSFVRGVNGYATFSESLPLMPQHC